MEAFWTGLRGKVGFSDLRNSLIKGVGYDIRQAGSLTLLCTY